MKQTLKQIREEQYAYNVPSCLELGVDINDFKGNPSITIYDLQLNELGEEGWELIDSYLEYQSYFVDISKKGNSVNGIKTKTAPKDLILIFKRPKIQTY